ncbi:HAD-IA family hydrolase [Gemmata sp. JC673]|uniref:HAD-IA family hydrolase n=1 Tax=Gemmata algarum TaxID=2975278 RepID=A0ABU5F2H6_9BACT|nr:HAD-IA family hydrolase [Gemmata algarum]MDY3561786.1 HAD-IA family hydrolase [Gemmata algarum]
MDPLSIRAAFFDLGDTLVVASDRRWVAGAREALTDLRGRGLRLGVISNTGNRSRAELAELLPPDFDWGVFCGPLVLLSAEIGVAKPDPEIFRRAVAASGVTAPECLFCTESLLDALVAQRVGMRAARVLPPPNADGGGLPAALVESGLIPAPSA